MELRLFHHYMTQYAPQQSRRDLFERTEMNQFFLVDVPKLAFGHQAVLSALLGLSACHYLSLAPGDKAVKRAARVYLDQTTSSQKLLVSRIDKGAGQAALLVSLLLVYIMKSRALLADECELYRPPLEVLHMIRGVDALFQRSAPFLSNDNPVV